MATKNKPFRTLLDPPVEIFTTPGNKIEDVIALRIDENGNEEFYVAGKTNVYEKIQAEAESAKIENIVAKVVQTGDTTILQQRKGHFVDLTEVPANIFEAQQKITEAEKTFMQLPNEIRKEYNNNFNEYLKDVGSEKWLELTGLKEKETVITEPEKKGADEE